MVESVAPIVDQLRVVLRGISPLIWRRLLVRSASTIADLHHTLHIAFGWSDTYQQASHTDGWFEVIAGKSTPAEGPAECFALVQSIDPKPKRRLFEVLTAQGMQMNQQVTVLTDGGNTVRAVPLYLNPLAEYWVD